MISIHLSRYVFYVFSAHAVLNLSWAPIFFGALTFYIYIYPHISLHRYIHVYTYILSIYLSRYIHTYI